MPPQAVRMTPCLCTEKKPD